MAKKISWIFLVILAIIVGLYPSIYFVIDRRFGLLQSKSNELLASNFWNLGFYTHIILGGLALLIGWTQFSTSFRNKNLQLHRKLGKVYVISVLFSSLAGIYIGFFATGGIISKLGFICLGFVWLSSTLIAYQYIRKGQIERHQKMMIYSYAACLAAVTLRIWLPVLSITFHNFIVAYTIVAWLCWVPNIIVANIISRRIEVPVINRSGL
jgi:uncharacterized membrane protein